jgi:hypothetical protein
MNMDNNKSNLEEQLLLYVEDPNVKLVSIMITGTNK